MPSAAPGQTAEPQVHDRRLIPGGSLESANTAIGMNAVDRDDLPSYGLPMDRSYYKTTR